MAWLSLPVLAAVFLGLLRPTPASAMVFESRVMDGFAMVPAPLTIQPGDAERFLAEIMLAPRGSKVVLLLNSGGG